MKNTKRVGRFNNRSDNNDNSDNSPSYFDQLTSLYQDTGYRPSMLKPGGSFFRRRRVSLEKLLARADKTIERSKKFFNKIKSKEIACSSRFESIPENATIRKEYIRCGKEICEKPHGPYYYAYWKDPQSKKLKKKYIGSHIPGNN